MYGPIGFKGTVTTDLCCLFGIYELVRAGIGTSTGFLKLFWCPFYFILIFLDYEAFHILKLSKKSGISETDVQDLNVCDWPTLFSENL